MSRQHADDPHNQRAPALHRLNIKLSLDPQMNASGSGV
jgi:hypothetical protein